jgi:hypothetical protein
MRPEAEHRRVEVPLQLRHLGDVHVERRRRRREENQRRAERFALETADQILCRAAFRGEIDEPHVAAGLAQQRREHRERVGRLGRAEHFLALLAAPLAREANPADEGRIHQERPRPDHQPCLRARTRR